MRKIVAIHQPNFLPWLGYFDKLARADVFVFLDNVQLQRTGGSYTNRVEMIISGRRNWVTVPISRQAEQRDRISEARIVERSPWRRKIKSAIEQSYAKAPHFAETMPHIARILDNRDDRLASFNTDAIKQLSQIVELGGRLVVNASALDVSGSGTDLLIAIVRAVGGTTYLCGGGATGYQEDEKFAAAGLTLEYQNFQHPVYPQVAARAFSAGLSIIDALMNCGAAGTARLLAPWRAVAESAER